MKFKSDSRSLIVFLDVEKAARFVDGKYETTDQKIQRVLKNHPMVEKVEEKKEEE